MQQRMRRSRMAVGLALWTAGMMAVGPAAMGAADTTDVSGAWVFSVKTDRGSGRPTFVFKQDGKTIKGTYRGFFGEAPVEGTMEGRAMKFSFKARSPLNPLFKVSITYAGTLDEATQTLSGTVDFEGQGSGTWTGKRKTEEAK